MVYAEGNANKYRCEITPFHNLSAKRTPPLTSLLLLK